jgi:hypothetical protein
MLKQVPTKVQGKTSLGKRGSNVLQLPSLTRQEIEDLVSASAINQQLEKMQERGLIPKGVIHNEPTRLAASAASTIQADVVDAVRWHDSKSAELQGLKTQDVNKQNAWVDTLMQDFIAMDINPSDTADSATLILKNLEVEISKLEKESNGPEAADYLFKLKRELELVVDNLKGNDPTPKTKDQEADRLAQS